MGLHQATRPVGWRRWAYSPCRPAFDEIHYPSIHPPLLSGEGNPPNLNHSRRLRSSAGTGRGSIDSRPSLCPTPILTWPRFMVCISRQAQVLSDACHRHLNQLL
ncbi:hypothetical protein U9M48_005510 [Paspalum notatum var. saurae]|uniref:Uncharacterized protein n=1 Tax=Paspalum notatum var. saurae TaxID=547442 RepID=A0AAQ3PSF1_PASNO